MNRRLNLHHFWGSHSPLSSLTGIGLIILASSRFSHALLCVAALLWVYGLTALVFSFARKIMPKRGKMIILLFLSTFLCGIFILLLSLFNPLLVIGTVFFLILIPPCCLGSGFFEALDSVDHFEAVLRALLEASVLAGIILAFSLIREPLGMGIISIPGGPQGIIEIFSGNRAIGFLTIRFFSTTAGAFLLLGYFIALYRYFKKQRGHSE